jgi:short-subunit dehydrogenase
MQQTKTALITGATSGIGYELAKIFSRNGFNLVIVARDQKALDKVKSEFSSQFHNQLFCIAADLSLPESPKQIFEKVHKEEIAVDVLVNNAGFGIHGDFATVDLEKHLSLIQVNISALTALTRLFLPEMLLRKQGKILNTASTAAFLPGPHMAVYYATKAYVLSFSEGLASELKGTGVTVTALCPGLTKTKFPEISGVGKSKLLKLIKPMNAEVVAQAGFDGLMKGKTIVIPGLKHVLMTYGARFAPRGLVTRVSKYTLHKL